MLIISKRKDYYDGVAGTVGVDKTIVYNRQIVEFDEIDAPVFFQHKSPYVKDRKENPFINLSYHDINKEYLNQYQYYGFFIVGFCGKLYIGWKLYSEEPSYNPDTKVLNTEFNYNFDQIKKIVKIDGYWGNIEENVNKIKNFNAVQLFRDLKTPVFIYDGDYNRIKIEKNYRRNNTKFIINPLLKDYEFYKMFNTFQAFQEIQMFLSGVLGSGEKEIIDVADKYKITQHGFDYKWSFRREPTSKI
jgi:hypothetical protein